MINRLFARPQSNFTHPNSQRPVNFARERHLTFAADLDRQMLECEQRHAVKTYVPSIPRHRIGTAASTPHVEIESCMFDDFGLVQGLEIDVRWM